MGEVNKSKEHRSVVNPKNVFEHHKKNLEALRCAHKKTAEVMKSVSTLHGQFAKQTFANLNSMVRGMMTKKPIHHFDHAEAMKNSLHRAVNHTRSVRGMLVDSHKEIHALVYERMKEAKEKIKTHIAKHAH